MTITPEKKYPFKIVKVSAKDGKDIQFELSEEKSEKGPVYALLIENKSLEKGRYFDMITLETASHTQPKLSIRVYGDLRQPAEDDRLVRVRLGVDAFVHHAEPEGRRRRERRSGRSRRGRTSTVR